MRNEMITLVKKTVMYYCKIMKSRQILSTIIVGTSIIFLFYKVSAWPGACIHDKYTT